MADIVDQITRSRMMSGIRGTNTKPEMHVRSLLHRKGFRFRLHVRDLPGKPDIVLPRFRAVVFVHGCFWHGHGCPLFKMPSTRRDFWKTKIDNNRDNDRKAAGALHDAGWRVATIWECAMRGPARLDDAILIKRLDAWLRGEISHFELAATKRSER
jgi:DNA mismatch endonuclease (patch repair protein)